MSEGAEQPVSLSASGHRSQERAAFEKLRRIWPTMSSRSDDAAVAPQPRELAFKLTNRCNLRCTHCYQWGNGGHHRDLSPDEQRADLDISVIEQVFAATEATKPHVYLWGGEPLVYADWDRLIDLLERDRRWTTICTNGLLIEKRLASLLPISDQLEVYCAVDGPEAAHDALRGKGTHARTMANIDMLAAARAAGDYLGEISINCVLSPTALDGMDSFVQDAQDRWVDTFYLALPWYLSPRTRREMDAYCGTHAPFAVESDQRSSWQAYDYSFDAIEAGRLMETIDHLESTPWNLKLRYNPRIDREDVGDFLNGASTPAQGKTRCLAIKSRMDVMPSGDVVSCKFFPESKMGNVHDADPLEIWHGDAFTHLRDTIDTKGLMPVCAKCNLLYSRGNDAG